MGTLYIVPTPVGTLEDITLRALRILGEVSLIAAEDTRNTGKLLAHFAIKTRMISYHEHNKLARLDQVFEALDAGDVALVSDAGTPGISDPGFELIREAISRGVTVIPLPGASALLPAVVASGLVEGPFTFIGFLPPKQTPRRRTLGEIASLRQPLVFYEAPHRLKETLVDMQNTLGSRPASIAREISKVFEEFIRGDLAEVIDHFETVDPRGEFVIVVGGAPDIPPAAWDEGRLMQAMRDRIAAGESRSAAARSLAQESGWPRRTIYDLLDEG